MITEAPAPTRERILDAAVELFGRQGYHGTSVGEIERAAGLSPRSGALYKHFPSKQALLTAVVRRRERAVDEIVGVIDATMLGDVRTELHLMARMALAQIGADQPVFRIVMRESDNFPELRDEFHRRIVRSGHAQTVAWLRLVSERTGVPLDDPDALASVLLGSIINYRVLDTLFGAPPGNVDEARFLAAWEHTALAALAAYGLVSREEIRR